MNLLRIEIEKILSEEKINDSQVRVKAIYNCYGIRETKDRLYSIDYWKKIKLRGHYYG